MKISTLITVSLIVLTTVQHICKTVPQFHQLHGHLMGAHNSLYSMVEGLLNNGNMSGNFGSIVALNWNGRIVAAKIQQIKSTNGRPTEVRDRMHFNLALAEATHLKAVHQRNFQGFGNVKPEFIACEMGLIPKDKAGGNGKEYLYMIILMDMLDNNFEKKHDDSNQLIKDLRALLKDNVLRLKIYLRMARSLQALHDSGRVHNDIKPANVVAKRDLSAVKWIDYGLIATSGEYTKVRGSPLYYDKRKFKIYNEDRRLFLRGRYVDQNSKAADIWAFALTIYQIECAVADVKEKTTAPGANIAQSFQSNIDAILQVDNDHCFHVSKIHEPADKDGRTILIILTKMLRLNRSQRKITALKVAQKLLSIIQNNDPTFLEHNPIAPTQYDDESSIEDSKGQLLLKISSKKQLELIPELASVDENYGSKIETVIEHPHHSSSIKI